LTYIQYLWPISLIGLISPMQFSTDRSVACPGENGYEYG